MNNALPSGCVPSCPGCRHRHLSAAASLVQKTAWLEHKLSPWQTAFLPSRSVSDEQRWNYRDRLCLSTQWLADSWQFGLWRGDELIDIPDCPVHSPRARAVINLLHLRLPPAAMFPLRFYVQSAAQICLVVKAKQAPNAWLDTELQNALQKNNVEGLWLNYHPSAGNNLFHKNGWHLLWGQPWSRDAMGLWYGPGAFQQLLPDLYSQALAEAAVFLAPGQQDMVVDLYCGRGASLCRWTEAGAQCIGVELSGEAMICAEHNAPKAQLLRGKCWQRLPQLQTMTANSAKQQRLLYLNPPRTGLESAVLDWVCDSYQPARIAYLSCSAGTLRRDLEQFCANGYHVHSLRAYDFFPQTLHVETLVLLERTE